VARPNPATWAGSRSTSVAQPTDRPRHVACARHAPWVVTTPRGTGDGAVCGDTLVDEVWRRQGVKLKLEEGEASGIVMEAQAHRSGGATWGRGGAVVR
jgi:hypothetical protein